MQQQHHGLSGDSQAILKAIHAMDDRHKQAEDQKHAENKRRLDLMADEQRQMKHEIMGIAKGFPDGDPDSHRRYHESVIEWRELRNKMVRDALVNAAKVGGLAGLGWLAFAIWTAFKMEIMR